MKQLYLAVSERDGETIHTNGMIKLMEVPEADSNKLIWNIKNLKGWTPVLWDNFDWDFGFLLKVMIYKLSKMEKYFEGEDCIAEDGRNTADEIKLAISLLNSLLTRDFEEKIIDENPRVELRITETENPNYHAIEPLTDEEREIVKSVSEKTQKAEKAIKEALCEILIMHGIGDWWE